MKGLFGKIKHPKGGYYTYISLNLLKIFKRNRWPSRDRFGRMFDYGVYLLIDESYDEWVFLPYMDAPIKGRLLYIGRGVIDIANINLARALNHKGDMMANTLSDTTCIYMFGCGMTYDESCALEACWILASGRELSKRKQRLWDGNRLINKRRERKWELKGKNILLPYGNNTRSITQRKTNSY